MGGDTGVWIYNVLTLASASPFCVCACVCVDIHFSLCWPVPFVGNYSVSAKNWKAISGEAASVRNGKSCHCLWNAVLSLHIPNKRGRNSLVGVEDFCTKDGRVELTHNKEKLRKRVHHNIALSCSGFLPSIIIFKMGGLHQHARVLRQHPQLFTRGGRRGGGHGAGELRGRQH